MLTRREMIAATLTSPYLVGRSFSERTCGTNIVAESHLLSRDSAAGFYGLLKTCKSRPADLFILPGTRELSVDVAHRILARVRKGAWLILESGLSFESDAARQHQTRIWAACFGLSFTPFRSMAATYVEYTWPNWKLVRSFDVFTPVSHGCGKIVAQCDGIPTCCTRRLGHGGIVFLGAMLGPGLASGEREAHELGLSIVESIGRV